MTINRKEILVEKFVLVEKYLYFKTEELIYLRESLFQCFVFFLLAFQRHFVHLLYPSSVDIHFFINKTYYLDLHLNI